MLLVLKFILSWLLLSLPALVSLSSILLCKVVAVASATAVAVVVLSYTVIAQLSKADSKFVSFQVPCEDPRE